jgi:hypothetical protein
MKPSELALVLPELIAMRRPVFVWGASGIGKSSVIHQVAKAMKRKVNDARLSQLESIDLRGFPIPDVKTKKMEWLPADFLPTKDDPPGILFLDEANGALPAVASAAYQLILDFKIGAYTLPDHWAIVAAGNNTSDRGVTHNMPAPLNNRFVHIDLEVDYDDWKARAIADGIEFGVYSYLGMKQSSLHSFDPTKNPRSFPTPRAWYFVDELVKRNLPPKILFELVKGTVGEGAAHEVTGYMRDITNMPDMDDVKANPKTAALPATPALNHAVVETLIDLTKPANFAKLMEYVTRLSREVQVVYVKGAVKSNPAIINTKAYADWAIANKDIFV